MQEMVIPWLFFTERGDWGDQNTSMNPTFYLVWLHKRCYMLVKTVYWMNPGQAANRGKWGDCFLSCSLHSCSLICCVLLVW